MLTGFRDSLAVTLGNKFTTKLSLNALINHADGDAACQFKETSRRRGHIMMMAL